MLRLTTSLSPLRRLTYPAHACKVTTSIRYLHSGFAEFTPLGPDDRPITTRVTVRHGDPEDAFILIPPAIGRALQPGESPDDTVKPGPPKNFARSKLVFHHDTQHIDHGR